MKKLLSIFIFIEFFFSTLAAQAIMTIPAAAKKVSQYTLENGMEVFLLEDYSSPLIRIDFSVKAGFSNQTQNTAGFYTLYSRILRANLKENFFEDVQCNSDSTRYIFTTTPSQLDQKLSDFSDIIFSTNFSEEILNSELTKLKDEVTQNANSPAGLINAAIDSKVFSDSPWKHDSGIYPVVFKRNTEKTARTILKSIGENYYTPQNSAIFISGNINSERLLVTLKNLFGKYYSSNKLAGELPQHKLNSKRKYVIHDPEFSKELTQVVVQYTMLDMEAADIAAATLNNNYSSFKQNVLAVTDLNIPGDEYINVASAHKKNSSRLIFQTLIQPPENKKVKINSLEQSIAFSELIKESIKSTSDFEFINAKAQLLQDLNTICSSSSIFMDNLSQFWAIKEYDSLYNNLSFEEISSPVVNQLLARFASLQTKNQITILDTFESESPFIFVIISDDDFKKNKKAYINAGFEEINSKNASWYVQEMYKNIRDQFKPEENTSLVYNPKSQSNDNNYFQRNISQLKTLQLNNGINVTYKQNLLNSGVSLLINIDGGKLNSADDHGFEEVMINLLASMIQRELYNEQLQGIILGNTTVNTNIQNYTSSILIDFETEDFTAVCNAISKAIIYGEVMPAMADRSVNARQYRKRLENGSAVSQMYSSAINSLFGQQDFSKIYDAKKEILQSTNYNKILSAYPMLLEANRYSLIICGNFPEELLPTLENNFGQLNTTGLFNSSYKPVEINIPKNKTQNVKIVHTFLTDIPAEKAGPMPAVLIPTTEFLDPVIYFIPAPEEKTAVFNAMMLYFEKIMQEEISKNKRINNAKVEITLPKTNLPLIQITVQNVAHIKELDAAYKTSVQKLNTQLTSIQAPEYIQKIKDYWSKTQMTTAQTNSGTALLIQKGYEAFPTNYQHDFYLTEYEQIQTAPLETFQSHLQHLPLRPDYRLYSTDAKN